MTIRVVAVVTSLLGLAGCAPSLDTLKPALSANDAGTVWFATPGRLVRPAFRYVVDPRPEVLSGDLEFPDGPGPFPAVVLAHGCGGVGNAEQGWIPVLRRAGYATLALDSFTGRGLREVCTNASLLTSLQRVPDAYGALRILATHPRVDARRIVLMGFSHGGGLTMSAATVWARDTYAGAGKPAFRAFFPFYPPCITVSPESNRISAPLRLHIGEADDWTPAAPCREQVDEMRAAGQDARITTYPGASHSFDNVGRPLTHLPAVDNGATCRLRFASMLGPLLNPETLATCLHKGATMGWNPAATERARTLVIEQLAEILR